MLFPVAPTLFALHAIFILSPLLLHRGHIFYAHFSFPNGSFFASKLSIFLPPFSTILILSSLNLFNSSTLSFNCLASIPPGVGGTKRVIFVSNIYFCLNLICLTPSTNPVCQILGPEILATKCMIPGLVHRAVQGWA